MKIVLITFVFFTVFACGVAQRPEASTDAVNKESVPINENNRAELPKDWKLVADCSIEFYVPSDLKEQKVQGIDSCVKKYVGKNIELQLDKVLIGMYPPKYSRGERYSTENDYSLQKISVDGQPAEIITFLSAAGRADFNYRAIFDVPRAGLTIWADCKSIEDRQSVIAIFKSVKFTDNKS